MYTSWYDSYFMDGSLSFRPKVTIVLTYIIYTTTCMIIVLRLQDQWVTLKDDLIIIKKKAQCTTT